jgi:hypothetical protein
LFEFVHPVLRVKSRTGTEPMTFFDPSPPSASHFPASSAIEATEMDRLSAIGSEANTQDGVMPHQVMKANVHTTRAVARMLLM